MVAQKLDTLIGPLREVTPMAEARVRHRVRAAVATPTQGFGWRWRPVQLAAGAALVLALVVSGATPLGHQARALAEEALVAAEALGGNAGEVFLGMLRDNGDGTRTLLDEQGNERGTVRVVDAAELETVPAGARLDEADSTP